MAGASYNRGNSKQNYGTPPELLQAIKHRLHIDNFELDVAADSENAVALEYFDEAFNALRPGVNWNKEGWTWCNPPYANIEPWVIKAYQETSKGAQTVMLIPASVGSNWWKEWVNPYAYIVYLNGRITFVGAKDPYPKDCALLFYTPWGFKGSEVWNWRDVSELCESELGED